MRDGGCGAVFDAVSLSKRCVIEAWDGTGDVDGFGALACDADIRRGCSSNRRRITTFGSLDGALGVLEFMSLAAESSSKAVDGLEILEVRSIGGVSSAYSGSLKKLS